MSFELKKSTYLTWVIYSLIISGYLVTMISPKAIVAGVSCVVGGLFSLILLKVVFVNPNIILSRVLIPMICILGITIWLLIINIKYSKHIKNNNVTTEYKTFNTISFILLLLQLILLAKDTPPLSIIAMITSVQLIVVFVIQMNLEHFITDG